MLNGEVREGDLVRVRFADGSFRFDPERRAATGGDSGRPRPERPEAAAGTPGR